MQDIKDPQSHGAAAPTPAPVSPSFNLPHARHAKRLPPELTPEGLLRIRQAAYQLPQVLTPADFLSHSDHAEAAREDLPEQRGLILLQKAVAGARPSRWIAPELMAVALRHLDVVGTAPTVRALMQQRTLALDKLGLSRDLSQSSGWSRLCQTTLSLSQPGWRIPVAYRLDLPDAAAVWDFYRDGDMNALTQAIGPAPAFAGEGELLAHLEALLARSVAGHEEHLDSLLPRLQAECATPQTLPLLKAACTRAQDRWERLVAELNTLAHLNSELAFQGYPDTFDAARRLQRSVTLFVGPPNSGKTHAAFERLAQAHDGAYLAPL
ncbi:MAG: helicase, partial [Burkholderiaceae bacterium]|nr:helicase [Burkholderiaceae bacterium]